MSDEMNTSPEGVAGTAEKSGPVNLAAETPEAPVTPPVEPPQTPVPPVPPTPPANQPVAGGPSEPGKIRGVGQLLKDSWQVFTKGWVKYLLYVLLIIAIALGLGGIMSLFVAGGFLLTQVHWILTVLLIVLGVLVIAYLAVSVGLGLSKLVYSFADGAPVGINESLKYGFKNSISFLAVMIVLGLILVVPLLLVGIVIALLVAVMKLTAATLIISLVLAVPVFVLTIYLGIMLTFVTPNFIAEGNRGLNAIKRSWHLVKGSFWKVFGRLLVMGAIGFAISLLQDLMNNKSLVLIVFIPYLVIQFIYSYISAVYSYLIYKDLVQNK